MTANIQLTREEKPALSKLLWLSPLAMAAGTVANLALYSVAGLVFPEVTAWEGAGVGQIIGANIVYLLIGSVVFALTARFSAQPARHYRILATVGLILSLWLPISATLGYGAPGVPPASVVTAVILSLMHVITYAISVPLFIRLIPSNQANG